MIGKLLGEQEGNRGKTARRMMLKKASKLTRKLRSKLAATLKGMKITLTTADKMIGNKSLPWRTGYL